MYTALHVASHVDYRLVFLFSDLCKIYERLMRFVFVWHTCVTGSTGLPTICLGWRLHWMALSFCSWTESALAVFCLEDSSSMIYSGWAVTETVYASAILYAASHALCFRAVRSSPVCSSMTAVLGDHIDGNTAGPGSRLTRLPRGSGATPTVIPRW